MEEDPSEDSNWLEEDIIQCPNCNKDLLWIEHSPFENGYYLYCDSCPKRVELSIYDKTFNEIQDSLTAELGNAFRDRYFEFLMPVVERKLAPCDCGGKYLFEAIRRCVYCSFQVIKGERNLWFINWNGEEKKDVEFLNQLVKNESLWK